MAEWKIGKNLLKGFLLKIICVKNAKTLVKDAEEMFQLVLFKSGTAILDVNGKNLAIMAPCVFCLNNKDRVIWTNPKSDYEMDIICFHPSVINHMFDCENIVSDVFSADWTNSVHQDRFLLQTFFEREMPYCGFLHIEVSTFNRMIQLFDKLEKQMNSETDYFWPCRSRSYLIEILIIIQMRYLDDSESKEFLELNESQKETDAILDYIHSNYSNKITIDQITKQFNINRNTLNQQFTKLTGYTPISYLIQHRLKVAESLLVNTGVPVYEICERVGFSELSNFMKSFKKKYGQTPANYRTQYTTMK